MTAARGIAVALVLVLVSGGWGSVAPSPSVGPTAPAPTASPSAPATVGAAPSSSVSPAATRPPIADLAVATHRVPGAAAGHIAAFASLGSEIVWSGGPGAKDSNLYRYLPGADEPELLYLNALRNSSITSVVGSAAGYAFTDERWDGDKPGGWRLWLLTAAGADPVLIDQSSDDRLIAPTIAMNDSWIAWEVVRGSLENPVNELRVASVADPLAPTTLLSYPGREVYMQFPSLWNDELWYGIADNDWAAITEKPRIEMIDLAQPHAPPVIYGADQRAFMPAPGRDVVAWKSGGTAEMSALNSGVLTIYWRAGGDVEELPLPGPEVAANRISYPSVGNRFIAWWDDIQQRQYVYDLAERQFRRLAEYDWTLEERIAKPSLSGDLLAFVHHLSERERYLEWRDLPR